MLRLKLLSLNECWAYAHLRKDFSEPHNTQYDPHESKGFLRNHSSNDSGVDHLNNDLQHYGAGIPTKA
jgi:hypothetical protein